MYDANLCITVRPTGWEEHSTLLLELFTVHSTKEQDRVREACSCNRCCSGKTISRSITYSECVCVWPKVSNMQCAYAILSSVACKAVQYFSTLSHKRHDFPGGITELKYLFRFSLRLFSETFFILRRKARYEQKCILVFV